MNPLEENQEREATTLTCANCGSSAVETKWTQLEFEYGKADPVQLKVGVPLRICKECHFEYLDEEAEDLKHQAVCRYRELHTPSEIRQLRIGYKMTRAEFARLTRLGEATVGRWERGEGLQNGAYDQLLYLLGFVDNIRRLQLRAPHTSRPCLELTAPLSFRAIEMSPELLEASNEFSLHLPR